ncbi:MAG: roadblock/LC7 domain-containing protein [Brachymonas sp.]|jgi:predicted regulator of Ras-like GTPase activity (Roadblock/LC7/MglB family)
MDEQVNIPEGLALLAQTAINALFAKLSGVKALVVASVDGFSVASHSVIDIDANKVAAMASSFSALGVVVAEESHMGNKKVVTLEAADGYVILLDIPRPDYPLVLSITASSDTILAQTLYLARETITQIQQACI